MFHSSFIRTNMTYYMTDDKSSSANSRSRSKAQNSEVNLNCNKQATSILQHTATNQQHKQSEQTSR